jgi:hypothetical protein
VAVHSLGQGSGQPSRRGGDQPQPAEFVGGLVGHGWGVGVLHPGSSLMDLAVLGASHVRHSGEDPRLNFHETQDNLGIWSRRISAAQT